MDRLRDWRAPLGAALAAALALGCGAGEASSERPPDVVCVLIDTLRSDRMSCYGYDKPTTPFLDGLAGEGVLFEDVTAQATWTKPSVTSIFHGRYLTAYRDALVPGWPTLAETFRGAGYATVAVVGNPAVGREEAFHRGFDVFADGADPGEADRMNDTRIGRERNVEELGRELLEQVDALLGGADRPPLFLYLHVMDPHHTYEPHPDLTPEVDARALGPAMPWGWQLQAMASGRGAEAPPEDPSWGRRWAMVNRQRGLYDQEIRFTDRGLERTFDGLRERGVLERAVVAVLADHGECLWERAREDQRTEPRPPDELFYAFHGAFLTRDQVGTPLILQGHGVPGGRRVEHPVENVDLFPTLLQLCDLPAPEGLHGRSLVPVMQGDEGAPYVFSFTHHAASVREAASGLELIVPHEEEGARWRIEPQLYHLPSDPEERVNLHDQRPDDVARLRERLRRWLAEHPTASNLEAIRDPARDAALRKMGYTADDIGR